MSNQNLPGPYWQDEDDAAYRQNGDSNGRSHRASPWDNGDFWRSDERGSGRGQRDRSAGGSRHSAGNGRSAAGRPAAGQPTGSRLNRVRDYVTDGRGWQARFNQTAGDLRKRFGPRGGAARDGNGSANGRADEDFWAGPSRSRAVGGRDRNGAGTASTGVRAAGHAQNGHAQNGHAQNGHAQNGYRGARRAANGANGANGYGEYRGGRTAVRDQPDFWRGDDGDGTAGLRSRIAERTRTMRGDRGGGGRGGGGRGGWDEGRGGRGGGFRNWLLYGSWWRHWTLKKALAVLGCAIAAFILLCIGVFFLLYSMTPIPTAAAESANWQSSNVYLANGQLLGTFSNGGQVRQLLTESQIPTVMDNAMAAAEDRDFYHEGGISVTGLMRAAFDDVFGHGNLQGGSTITMQYAKNYYQGVDSGQNITTKMKEIFIAMKLAHERSKPWVMTNYLNTVPFGAAPQGLGAAAEYYFGINLTKPGATLTIAQAAMLAAMPNAPGYFDPNPHAGAPYTALVARWQYVLANMVRDGNITQQQASAQKFPKIVTANTGGLTGYKGYLWQMAQQELEAPKAYGGYGLTQHQLETGGYKITTTFSMSKVYALTHAVNWGKDQIAAIDGSFPGYDWIGSVLENVKTGAIVAIDGGPGWGVKNCNNTNVSCYDNRAEFPEEVGSSSKPYVLATAVSQYMSVFTSKLNGYEPLAIPYAPAGSSQATITATENMRSRLSAPPGQNLNTDNATFTWNNIEYKVFNEQGENYGVLAVNAATALSSDAAYEDLAHRVGIDNIIDMAAKFGVGQNPFNQNCPIGGTAQQMKACSDLTGTHGLESMFSTNPKLCNASLNFCGSPQITYGAAPLTPVEQASTFATLADDGVYHSPHVISQVVHGSTVLPTDVKTRQVLTTAMAADVDYALSFDNNFNGATANGSVSFRRGGVIGKTGTLGTGANANTAWFIGATPDEYSLSVALYTQLAGGTSETLNNLPGTGGTQGEFGGAWPATIWNYFMTNEFPSPNWLPVTQIFPPVNGAPFTAWIQVTPPPPKKQCQFTFLHGLQNCQCKGGHKQCTGNPNPTNSNCPPFNPACGTTQQTSSPDASSSPNPSPSPSPSPSASAGGLTTQAAEDASSALALVPQRGG